MIFLACANAPSIAAHGNPAAGDNLLLEFWHSFRANLFKPLLLFFMVGLSIPLLKIPLEFPYAMHQGLTIYLLIAVGWHGGEELAVLSANDMTSAAIFMLVGFMTNTLIGFLAYFLLRNTVPSMRRVDVATVSAYYGSDSAGTFLTCMGTLQAAKIAFASYMPVMLAIMEIPGCLVGLYLVSRLRRNGMDSQGFMPDEIDSAVTGKPTPNSDSKRDPVREEELMALENALPKASAHVAPTRSVIREIFLNPGLFLLMSGILVGYISRLQGPSVVKADDQLFIGMFQGILCLFLLEMGMTAGKRMPDLAPGSIAMRDLRVQRHHRHPRLYTACQTPDANVTRKASALDNRRRASPA